MATDSPLPSERPPLVGAVAPPSLPRSSGSPIAKGVPATPVIYPDSDGQRMSDNTKQARWIVILFGNLAALFRERTEVFVAADLLWYAEEGDPGERMAPDVMVAFGRPKGDRGSYKQWEENGVPVTVAFEILSPGNTPLEMADKLAFYDEHGVEEYYIYDPDTHALVVYQRGREALRRIWFESAYVSPRLGIRFDLAGTEMTVFHPSGRRFLSFEELEAEREEEGKRRVAAEKRADTAEKRASAAEQRAARLAELGRKVRRGQASAEDLLELERLEEESSPPTA